MYHVVNSQAPMSIVTLASAKSQCRLMNSFILDDDYLNGLIDTCVALSQTFCNRLLTVGEVSVSLDNYQNVIQLWGGEVKVIKSITAEDADGSEIDVTDFKFNPISQKLHLDTKYLYFYNFTITYDAGYVTPPVQVKQAILLMVSTLYNNRDDYVTGLTVANLPLSSQTLLNSIKHYIS